MRLSGFLVLAGTMLLPVTAAAQSGGGGGSGSGTAPAWDATETSGDAGTPTPSPNDSNGASGPSAPNASEGAGAPSGETSAGAPSGQSAPSATSSTSDATATNGSSASSTSSGTANTASNPPVPNEIPSYANGSTGVHSDQQQEDNGRNVDLLFIQAEGGLSYVDLTGLQSNGAVLPSLAETKATGYGAGVTIGFRSWIFALAAHGYISRFGTEFMSGGNGYDLGEVMLEGQIRLPIPLVEPYIRVGLGYAWLGDFQLSAAYADSTSSINGFVGKAGVGADIWLGKFLTVGAGIDFAVMNLRRGGVQRSGSACPMTDPTCVELSMDGDSIGTLTIAHVQIGLHF